MHSNSSWKPNLSVNWGEWLEWRCNLAPQINGWGKACTELHHKPIVNWGFEQGILYLNVSWFRRRSQSLLKKELVHNQLQCLCLVTDPIGCLKFCSYAHWCNNPSKCPLRLPGPEWVTNILWLCKARQDQYAPWSCFCLLLDIKNVNPSSRFAELIWASHPKLHSGHRRPCCCLSKDFADF